jgi:beta-lactam-binding protein with PASTA domain
VPPGNIRRGAPARQLAYTEEEEEPQNAGAWGWIAAVLGVLVLFAGALLLFLLLSNRPAPSAQPTGGITTVPSLVGQTLEQARTLTSQAGLILTVGGYEVTDEAPEGTIIAQNPVAGGQADRGSELSVTIATLRQTVAVPEMRLRTEAQLFELLAQANLAPGLRTEAFDPQVPATLVTATSPRAGVEVARGTAVDYVVSLGQLPTPSPSPSPSPTFPPTEPPTALITPAPTPPPTAPPTPSPSPSPTPSPTPITVANYSTCVDTLGQVKAAILAAGLQVGSVFPYEAQDADWVVAQQYPLPGEAVPPGTRVDLLAKSPADTCP